MKQNGEALYFQLRELMSTMPDLAAGAGLTPDGRQWLGRAFSVVEAAGETLEAITFRHAMDGYGSVMNVANVNTIQNILYRVLSKLELAAPTAMRGQYIAAGEALTALAVVAKIFARAEKELLLVDAYADHTILTDFAITAPLGKRIRILTADKDARRQALMPASARWRQQFGSSREISVRVTLASKLHDRLIVVDDKEVWLPAQSFNGMAQRSHTSIALADAELAAMKIDAYRSIWDEATEI